MTPIAAYLNFDGNCREAMTFYQQCLGGELEVMTFRDIPPDDFEPPADALDRVMHAYLSDGTFSLMASDTMPGTNYTVGNHASLLLQCDSAAQVDERFAALSAGGSVNMPPADVFWGAYFAAATDRFGMGWMLSHERAAAPA
jgi:PhnB protein